MPYVLISAGGVFLTLTLLGTGACLIQHHSMMVKHGMTRYNNDLVRRKDKVKARKADNKPLNKYEISSQFITYPILYFLALLILLTPQLLNQFQ